MFFSSINSITIIIIGMMVILTELPLTALSIHVFVVEHNLLMTCIYSLL